MSRAELDAVLGFATSDEQWDCISAPLEPFVIIAGAGTGKTAVMAARVLWLVASGLATQGQVLGLTFTNKAAAELASRVTRLLDQWRRLHPQVAREPEGEPTIATYHSFARRLVDEQGLRVGVEPGARLLSAASVALLAYRLVCTSDSLAVTQLSPARVAADVVTLDANLAEQTLTVADVREHCLAVVAEVAATDRPTHQVRGVGSVAERRLELLELVQALRRARADAGGVDFSDYMRLCVELVQRSPELVRSVRTAFPVVLLDEYQDTSIAQRVILSTLFAGSGVTAVGDPLQAIYGWRSASVANIAAFGAHFGGVGGPAPTRVLSVNRRSGEQVLAAANRVSADLRLAHPQVAALRAPGPRPSIIRTALLETAADERAWIVEQVADLVAHGCPPQDIGILGRTNESLALLHEALQSREIPASISGVAALESSPYALSVLSTLRLLHDPADNRAAVALLSGQRWRIGPADLEALAHRAQQLAEHQPARPPSAEASAEADGSQRAGAGSATAAGAGLATDAVPSLVHRLAGQTAQPDRVERPSLLEAISDPGPLVGADAVARLRSFRDEIRSLYPRVGDPLPDLVARVLSVTGAQIEADLMHTRTGTGDVALGGLLEIVDGFSDVDGRTGLGAFLAHLDVAEQLGTEEEVDLPVLPGCVQLMTIHKAKGLEFPVVVLPHLSVGVFPGAKGSDRWTTQPQVVPFELRDDSHVLPELGELSRSGVERFVEQCRRHDRSGDDRLAYVAVTRARDTLIASGHWWGPTQKRPRGPSAYLEALRAEAGSDQPWCAAPFADESGQPPVNPTLGGVDSVPWPAQDIDLGGPAARAAQAVAALLDAAPPHLPEAACVDPAAGGWVHREVAAWDEAVAAIIDRLDRQAGPAVVRVPRVLSASRALDLARDPDSFAASVARPMPAPRNPWAELGTAFHAWVEARLGTQPLITDDELPGAADHFVTSDAELAELKEAFERLPHAGSAPAGLEVPFSLAIAGRLVRGRIDAVFPALPDAPTGVRWDVVDWKTSGQDRADALQLAIYRVAWAELAGVPLDQVRASFVFVRSGRVTTPPDLPERAELAALLQGQTLPTDAAPSQDAAEGTLFGTGPEGTAPDGTAPEEAAPDEHAASGAVRGGGAGRTPGRRRRGRAGLPAPGSPPGSEPEPPRRGRKPPGAEDSPEGGGGDEAGQMSLFGS